MIHCCQNFVWISYRQTLISQRLKCLGRCNFMNEVKVNIEYCGCLFSLLKNQMIVPDLFK